MSLWLIAALTVWGVGALVSVLFVTATAMDEDWKFWQIGLALLWLPALIWIIVFRAGDPRNFPDWFRRHW
jgi:peptidoglycan/LPS O-acetylase OafA/YrhL